MKDPRGRDDCAHCDHHQSVFSPCNIVSLGESHFIRFRERWIKWSHCYVGSHNAAHCDVGPTPSYTQRPVSISDTVCSQTHQTCCVSFETKTQSKPHLLSYLLKYEQVQTSTEQLPRIQNVAGLLLNVVDISKKLWQWGAMWCSI